MAGPPYLIRLGGYGFRFPKDRVRGREVAGWVQAVGANVTILKPGDDAYGIGEGAFAEYTLGRADKLAPKPTNLTYEQAAAATISALTTLQAVRDAGHVESGQKVLIIGASGGVGSFAVQIAKAFGAEVTGVASTAKLEMVHAAGADHVIDYSREDITTGGRRYDVILDTGGDRTLRHLRRALTPTGTLVIVGGETGGRILGGFDFARYVESSAEGFPDVAFKVEDIIVRGDRAVLQWRMTGTNTGPLPEFPCPTGRTVDLPGVDIIEVGPNGIVTIVGYFDQVTFFRQLGVELQPVGT